MYEYWVEYDWQDSPYGKRPNLIRCFKTEQEAKAFAETTEDGKLVGIEFIER